MGLSCIITMDFTTVYIAGVKSTENLQQNPHAIHVDFAADLLWICREICTELVCFQSASGIARGCDRGGPPSTAPFGHTF